MVKRQQREHINDFLENQGVTGREFQKALIAVCLMRVLTVVDPRANTIYRKARLSRVERRPPKNDPVTREGHGLEGLVGCDKGKAGVSREAGGHDRR